MGWSVMGWGTVVGLFVIRLLLRQVRGLLVDVGTVIRAWRELLHVVRGTGPPTGGGVRCGTRRSGCGPAPKAEHQRRLAQYIDAEGRRQMSASGERRVREA